MKQFLQKHMKKWKTEEDEEEEEELHSFPVPRSTTLFSEKENASIYWITIA